MNPVEFFIEVKEIEKPERFKEGGVIGGTKNSIYGFSDLSDLLFYLYSNTNRSIKEEDINLTKNPFLEIKLVAKRNCDIEVKAENLLKFIGSKYSFKVDSFLQKSDFIVINSIDNFEKPDPELGESSIGTRDSLTSFKNISVKKVLNWIQTFNGLKIMVNEENFPINQKINLQLPIESLESMNKLEKKLRELNIDCSIKEQEFWQYIIKN